MRDKTGKSWSVPESERAQAEQRGAVVVTRGEDMPGSAFVAGMATGMAGGLPGLFLSEEEQKNVAGLRQQNPTATMLGEGTTLAVESLATGGARAVTGGLAKSAMKMAARGSAEGAASAITGLVNESVIENKELTAESVASRVAASALTGGVLNTALGLPAKYASQAVGASVGNKAVMQTAEDYISGDGRTAFLKHLFAKPKELSKYGLDDKWGAYVLDEGEKLGLLQPGTMRGVQRAAMKHVSDATDEMNQLRAQLNKAVSPETYVIQPSAPGDSPQSIIMQGLAAGQPYQKALSSASASERQAMIAAFRETEEHLATAKTWDAVVNQIRNLKNSDTDGVRLMGRLLDEDAMTQVTAKALGPGAAQAWKSASSKFHVAHTFSDLAGARASETASDAMRAAAMAGGGALVFGGGSALAYGAAAFGAYSAKNPGGLLIGRAMKAIGDRKLLQKAGESLAKTLQTSISAGNAGLTMFRTTLEAAASEGTQALLETHARLAAGPSGPQYLEALGLPQTPDPDAGARISTLVGLEESAPSVDPDKTPRRRQISIDHYEAVAAKIKESSPDPESVYRSLPDEIRANTPQLAMASTQKILEVNDFLRSKLPRSPDHLLPTNLQRTWTPSAAEKQRFLRYVEAVADPMSILRIAKTGMSVREHAEVVKRFYPEHLAAVQSAIIEDITAAGKGKVSYQEKLRYTNAFGGDFFGISQDRSRLLQTAYGKAREQQSPQQQAPGGDGRQMVNTSKNLATQAQRMESR
jgi:hypothetical protein